MGSIQFIGKEAVLAAFNELDAESWGLFDGKTPILFGEGSDNLETWLDRFAVAGSTAQYTLRVYETALPVKTNTDFIASFKFRLSDPYQGAGISGNTTKLLERIGELEKRIDEGDGEGEDIMDHIIGWFKEPEKLETVIGAFKNLLGGQSAPGSVPVQNAQAMAGYKVMSEDNTQAEEKLEKLAGILDALEKRDPKLLEHLEKLSKLDALTFNMVIQRVDAL